MYSKYRIAVLKTKQKNNPGSLDYFFHGSDLQSAAVQASVQAGQWLWTQELQGARVRMQTQELAELAAKGRRLLHWRLEAGWMVPLEWTGRRWSWTGGTDTGEVIIIKWKKQQQKKKARRKSRRKEDDIYCNKKCQEGCRGSDSPCYSRIMRQTESAGNRDTIGRKEEDKKRSAAVRVSWWVYITASSTR